MDAGILAQENGNKYFVYLTNKPGGIGERSLLIASNPKTVKKYLNSGYYIFATPLLLIDGLFYSLTKEFKHRTRNRKKIVIGNELYHIQQIIDDNSKIFIDN